VRDATGQPHLPARVGDGQVVLGAVALWVAVGDERGEHAAAEAALHRPRQVQMTALATRKEAALSARILAMKP
jgi:hypothetical protein